MRNIRLTISYDGTRYAGWQSQKNAKAIQDVIESLLKKITGRAVKLKASGRTDSGVHAKCQVANFRTRSKLPLKSIKNALNSNLPDDILISSVSDVPREFDSRKCAKLKHYRYTVTTSDFIDPFLRHFVARFSYPLSINAMRMASSILEGKHDFKAFQASGADEKRTVRTVSKIRIAKKGDLVYIDIWADGFLYNMVRTIVGTLFEVGRGKFTQDRITQILSSKNRALVGPTLPAKGLCLMDVEY